MFQYSLARGTLVDDIYRLCRAGNRGISFLCVAQQFLLGELRFMLCLSIHAFGVGNARLNPGSTAQDDRSLSLGNWHYRGGAIKTQQLDCLDFQAMLAHSP